jgi:O-antigen ligase/polysaccharide polymerase Wzy-like membrane protein
LATISPVEGGIPPPVNSTAGLAARIARWAPAAYAGLAPILFIPFSVDAYILPRTGLTLLAGAVVGGLGLATGTGRLGRLRWPALAVALAALVAAAFSVAPALTLVGEYSRYESLPVRLAYLALFAGAAWTGERRRLVSWFLVGCSVASVEALAQWAAGSPARPDGNLGQANLLGALLAMAVPLAVDRARWHPAWLAVAGLAGLGLVASSSRSGWVGALVGLCVYAAFRVPARRLRPTLAVGAVAVAFALALGLASPLRFLNQDTGSGRVGVWRDTVSLVAAHPLVGWGEDTFGVVYGRFQKGDWSPGQSFDRAHSMPLDLAASQGLAGLAACTWFFAVLWRGLWRRPELGALGGALAAYFAWSLLNFDWAPATGPFWLLAGAAWSAVPQDPRCDSPPARSWWKPAIAITASVAALGLTVPPQLADALYYAGHPQQAAAFDPLQPRYQAALGTIAGYQRAIALKDPDPTVYVRLGDALLQTGHRREARAAYEQALVVYPYQRDAAFKLQTER